MTGVQTCALPIFAAVGQTVALPKFGTVGGALSVGASDIRRLGDGPVRDVLLQAIYVGADGHLVKAGGPTVKNVSGFDLCRLLVGSRGTLGFLAEVILRTRPLAAASQWYTCDTTDAATLLRALYRPVSVLWNARKAWVLLEGHPADLAQQSAHAGLIPTDTPPHLPTGSRRSVRPSEVFSQAGTFIAEVGVGIVHHADPAPARERESGVEQIAARIKREFDPEGRLNPGVVA